MVQHYFPSKEAMMDFAMEAASARYGARMAEAMAGLGQHPSARSVVRAALVTLLPLDERQRADGRVALAFQSYAATKRSAAQKLSQGNADLRRFVADQVRTARAAGEASPAIDPVDAATALLAMAEGLGAYLLTGGLSTGAAVAALDAQLDLTFPGPPA
jgi:AcrR family transcriptional regulator